MSCKTRTTARLASCASLRLVFSQHADVAWDAGTQPNDKAVSFKLGQQLRHQDSGVTPKTPSEALEAQARSREFHGTSQETPSPSLSPEPEDKRRESAPVPGNNNKGKRRAPEPEAEEAPK